MSSALLAKLRLKTEDGKTGYHCHRLIRTQAVPVSFSSLTARARFDREEHTSTHPCPRIPTGALFEVWLRNDQGQ